MTKENKYLKEIAKQLEKQNAYASYDVATKNKTDTSFEDKKNLINTLERINDKYSKDDNE